MSSRHRSAMDAFLAGTPFAVAGASRSRWKYGNKCLRCYWQKGRVAYPVNPEASEVEGARSYPNLSALPERVHGVSLITRPSVTEEVVEEALALGIRHFWMQPGAESDAALRRIEEAGGNAIHGGPCLLVVLGYSERGLL